MALIFESKRRLRFGVAAAVVLGIILLIAILSVRQRTGVEQTLAVLWEVPAFSAVDQDGGAVTGESLRGRVWIASFIFTRCTTVCPLITTRMAQLRRSLPGADVRFVSFSVDPEFDTPAVLKQYARGWSADARWLLLNAGPDGVRTLARGMKAALDSGAEANGPLLHSSQFFLVDRGLKVRGVYDSADAAALRRLVADASVLETVTAAPVPRAGATSTDGDGATLPSSAEAPQGHAADPVCGMMVAVSAEHPHAGHGGKRYYFCSVACRDEFLKNPDRYIQPN